MMFRDKNREWRHSQGGSLDDPNEQEQGKCMDVPHGDPPKKPPKVDDPRPSDAPSEIHPHPFPVECPSRGLPDTAGGRYLTQTAESRALFDGTPKKTRTRRSSARFAGYLVMSASLLLAFLLMIGALCFLPSQQVVDPSTDDRATDDDAAQKVVFVDRYTGGESGLSTPELYSRCISSVVSISARNDKHSGVGSGFVLREDGYIATAYHVVEGMTQVEVILNDERHYEARIVGGDRLTDLALLKIEETGLSPVTVGSSASLLPGERVVAIGTPASLDYAGSVSSGEVSYCLRAVKIYGEGKRLEKKMKLIQTNAPVNPGNSGCPLFDGQGRVVGMVTMKLGNSFDGMGFAIPSDGALPILEAMRAGEVLSDEVLAAVSVRAATLGVDGEAYEVSGVYGVRVRGFHAESRACAVLAVGDLVTEIGDHVVTRMADVEQALSAYEPGETVKITVLRNGQRLQFDIVLGAISNRVEK